MQPQYLGARRTVDPAAFARLTRRIRRDRPDVVHAHLEMAMTMALPAAALAGVPAVGTFHHVYRPLTGRPAARERLAVEVATRSDAAVFVSRASLTSFAEQYRPDQPPPSIVDRRAQRHRPGLLQPRPRPARWPHCPPTWVSPATGWSPIVAALRDFKGIGHAIRAWPNGRRPAPGRPAAAGRLGDGGGDPARRGRRAGPGVTAGRLRRHAIDIPAVLRGSDVVLLPSIYGENLPTVLMEAGGCAPAGGGQRRRRDQ